MQHTLANTANHQRRLITAVHRLGIVGFFVIAFSSAATAQRNEPLRDRGVQTLYGDIKVDAVPGGGTLGVTTRASADRSSVIVEISDTGKGIPAELLPTVTDPFFTTRPEGTGLGLAIAKRFVEQNGGTLVISSTVGRGTTVGIHFPAAPAMAGSA